MLLFIFSQAAVPCWSARLRQSVLTTSLGDNHVTPDSRVQPVEVPPACVSVSARVSVSSGYIPPHTHTHLRASIALLMRRHLFFVHGIYS